MSRTLWARLLACLAAVMLTAACNDTISGSPTGGPGPGPSDGSVGELEFAWQQYDSDLGDAVLDYMDLHPTAILIKDQAEYDAWSTGLPAPMQPDAADIELNEQVAVVGYYSKCMDKSAILNHGDGEIEFDVSVSPEDKNTMCEASPVNIELWIINLDELDVQDPDELILLD